MDVKTTNEVPTIGSLSAGHQLTGMGTGVPAKDRKADFKEANSQTYGR